MVAQEERQAHKKRGARLTEKKGRLQKSRPNDKGQAAYLGGGFPRRINYLRVLPPGLLRKLYPFRMPPNIWTTGCALTASAEASRTPQFYELR
jgi:hypothetical protein